MPKKQKPDLTIIKLGNHLFEVTRKDGSSFLKWDWDVLQDDVNKAMINHLLDKTLVEVNKLDSLVTKTETILKKSRKKKKEV